MTVTIICKSFPVGPSRLEGAKPLITMSIEGHGLPMLLTWDDWGQWTDKAVSTQLTRFQNPALAAEEIGVEIQKALAAEPEKPRFDPLQYTGWHLPLVTPEDWDYVRKHYSGIEYDTLARVSAGRCYDWELGSKCVWELVEDRIERSLNIASALEQIDELTAFTHQGHMDHAGHETPHLRGGFRHWNQFKEVLLDDRRPKI